jgi:sugar-specific transcriptional regulator TrmB
VLDTHPTTFQAVPPQVAIDNYVKKQIQELEEVKVGAVQTILGKATSRSKTRIDTISGRKAMFEKYVELLKKAKAEVLIISVGEPVPDELKLANRDALERGVVIKFIPHRNDENNSELLRSWLRMGIEVRHFPDSGYHLVVLDGKQAILAASNPINVAERTSTVIYGEGLSRALRDHFYSIWQKSEPLFL